MSGSGQFGGVYVPATATVLPAAPRGPNVLWLGNSGCEPTIPSGAAVPWNGMATQFADAMGWDDVKTACVGGTDWLNPGTGGKVNLLSRISTDVCPYAPDIVFLPWGINDSAYTPAQESAQGQLIINAIKACTSKTQIVMGSAWVNKGGGSLVVNDYAINTATKALAASNGLKYLDIIEPALPPGVMAQTTALQQAITSTSAGGQLYTTSALQIGGVYAFADGQHFIAKDSNYVATGEYSTHYDALQQTEASGATLTQVGWPAVFGGGSVGHTQGYGNADVVIGADQTHPSSFGHQVIGAAYAAAWLNTITPGN